MLTRRHGGFRLVGRKLLSVWRWALCHRRRGRGRRGYLRLQPCQPGRRSDSNDRSPLVPAAPALYAADKNQQFLVRRERDDVVEYAPSSPRRVLTWGRSLARRMRLLPRLRRGGAGGKERLLLEEETAEATTPKGQVAVYVGGAEPGGESMRYVVPVVYFNHPLFGELLREAEEEFGFEHPGGITIPCAASRFERAAAVAAAGGGGGKKLPGWW
ncbi:unnamed protein product [Urochloa decumbens]|uniref:Uncharacterized protein n=1 Tax=Urochloa decumbens TaxID=240449 RepID=A0ABC8V9F4_9POAL